jgi:hypothetical protein
VSEPPKNLLPGLSAKARKRALDSLVLKLPTAEIVALVGAEFSEVVSAADIDRARLLCVGKIEKYLADRDEVLLLSNLGTMPIERSIMAVALDQQALICYELGKSLREELASLEHEPDPSKKAERRSSLLMDLRVLALNSASTTRSQALQAKYAIELPFRKEQLYGKKEAPRSDITDEFVLEMERFLGVLPYDENFEPQVVDASIRETT